jgi:hypothetical protein
MRARHSALLACCARADPGFVHPGVLLGGKQLAFAKAQAARGVAPFNDTLAKAIDYTFVNKRAASSISPGWNGTISCGYYGSHDVRLTHATPHAPAPQLQP